MSIVTRFEAYLLAERRVSANTLSAYRRDLAQYFSFLKSHNASWESSNVALVKIYLAYLKQQGIGPRSVARKIAALKHFFTFAAVADLENIVNEISIPKREKKLPNFLSEDSIATLLQVADADHSELGKRNRVMLYMLYVSGMRVSELINLKISDVFFDSCVLKIVGKGGKERLIPLPEMMLILLRDYITSIHTLFMKAHKVSTDYLFPVMYAGIVKPITRQSFWIILKKMWEQTGDAHPISPHTLRHSLATHMLKNGVDLRSLQLMLGHESIATVQVYTHIETSHAREVYDEKHPRSQ